MRLFRLLTRLSLSDRKVGLTDIVIVGGGPGGYAAALYAHNFGLGVTLVDEERPGGTCLLRGCIPAKQWLQIAEVFSTVTHAAEFGVNASQPELDWDPPSGRPRSPNDDRRPIDTAGSFRWIGSIAPSKPHVFLTHGEARGRDPLKRIIQDRHKLKVNCPDMFETIEI